jgi:hypothetical protein
MFEWPCDNRTGRGGINGENGACGVGNIRHLADVHHVPGRIDWRFHPEKFRALRRRLHGSLIGHVDILNRDAAGAGHVVQEVPATPVEDVGRDDLPAGLKRLQQTGKARQARSIDHRGVAALERCNDALGVVDGLVAIARIKVLADELVVVVAGIGGGCVERRHNGTSYLVRRIQRLRGNGLGAALAVRHAGRH